MDVGELIINNIPSDVITRFGAEYIAKHVFHVMDANPGSTDIDALTREVIQHLKQGVAEAKEHYKDKKESGDLHFSDPVMRSFMAQARAKYPWLGSDETVLFKLLQRSMDHSIEADQKHDKELADLTRRVKNLEQQAGKQND